MRVIRVLGSTVTVLLVMVSGLVAQAPSVPATPQGGRAASEASVRTRTDARTLSLSIPGPRGIIADREGRPLAQNRVAHYYALQFAHFENPTDPEILRWARQRIAHVQTATDATWPVMRLFWPTLA